MERELKGLGLGLLAGLLLGGCGGLKYEMLKGTSLANPPEEPIKIYIKEFQVESKASVIDPRAAVGGGDPHAGTAPTNTLSQVGSELVTISRPSRIEDLSGSVLRELRREQVRVLVALDKVEDLEDVRLVENPFELVPAGSAEAQLEITGKALLRSQRVEKKFSRRTNKIEVEVQIKDLKSGKSLKRQPLQVGIEMVFNSKELEEAMAVAVVTYLTQKILF